MSDRERNMERNRKEEKKEERTGDREGEREGREMVVVASKIKDLQDIAEIKDGLFELLDTLTAQSDLCITPRATVMIKPNLCFIKGHETGTTVDPFLVECLVEWLNKNHEPRKIIICEADATQLNADMAFRALGWEALASRYSNVSLLNLSRDEKVNVKLNGLFLKEIEMSKSYMESDLLISVAKLKTHTISTISCCLKNIFGANPLKRKVKYHPYLNEVIHDINKVRVPDLCLVDGIIGMEGSGPVSGVPKPIGVLVAGCNPVAVDHFCARIMGFAPEKIPHLEFARRQDLGSFSYRYFGADMDEMNFNFRFGMPMWKKAVYGIYNNRIINYIPFWKRLLLKILSYGSSSGGAANR